MCKEDVLVLKRKGFARRIREFLEVMREKERERDPNKTIDKKKGLKSFMNHIYIISLALFFLKRTLSPRICTSRGASCHVAVFTWFEYSDMRSLIHESKL